MPDYYCYCVRPGHFSRDASQETLLKRRFSRHSIDATHILLIMWEKNVQLSE